MSVKSKDSDSPTGATIADVGRIILTSTTIPKYPDTGESGETYDLEHGLGSTVRTPKDGTTGS